MSAPGVEQENLILEGIVGSTAYRLAGPDSDIDMMGLFAVETLDLFKLRKPPDTVVTTKPDSTYHEAGKYAGLALKCNPAILELMWLPEHLYTTISPDGEELIEIRASFLSERLVRNAYLGYATSQFEKLQRRGDEEVHKKTAKHARHIARLAHQGYALYATGSLPVELKDPEFYHQFGDQVAEDGAVAQEFLTKIEADFDRTVSPLPELPDFDTVEEWLLRVRRRYLKL